MSERSEWKIWEYGKCRKCGQSPLHYQIVEDDECHEDEKVKCFACGHIYWVDGSDY